MNATPAVLRLAQILSDELGAKIIPEHDPMCDVVISGRVNLIKAVQAVLDALRTPSEDMIAAGDAAQMHCSDSDFIFDEMIKVARHGLH